MVGGLALGSEIKRFARNRMTRIAIVVLMLMPLSYGALYLWAYWDPFGHVNKLPVALVNSDRGTTVSGEPMNVGTQIADSLTDDASLDWHLVDDAEARDGGVAHGKYYFMLELPPDFSAAIASPTTGNPPQGTADRRIQRRQQLHLVEHRPHRDRAGTQRRIDQDLRAGGQPGAVGDHDVGGDGGDQTSSGRSPTTLRRRSPTRHGRKPVGGRPR